MEYSHFLKNILKDTYPRITFIGRISGFLIKHHPRMSFASGIRGFLIKHHSRMSFIGETDLNKKKHGNKFSLLHFACRLQIRSIS